MRIVAPEVWYRLFWLAYGAAALIGLYFVGKWAIIAAVVELRRRGLI